MAASAASVEGLLSPCSCTPLCFGASPPTQLPGLLRCVAFPPRRTASHSHHTSSLQCSKPARQAALLHWWTPQCRFGPPHLNPPPAPAPPLAAAPSGAAGLLVCLAFSTHIQRATGLAHPCSGPMQAHTVTKTLAPVSAGHPLRSLPCCVQAYQDMHMWWTMYAHKTGPSSERFRR